MSDPTGPETYNQKELVQVATEELRTYADKVREYRDRVEELRGLQQREKLIAKDWGVGGVTPFPPPVDEDGNLQIDKLIVLDVPDALAKFRKAYEAAEAALDERLLTLAKALDLTAVRFSGIAGNYDYADGVTVDDDGTTAVLPRPPH